MTIERTVEIPADRRLTIDVPREIPTGTTAHFEIRWVSREKAANNLDDTLEKIWTLCKDSSVTVDSFLEMRRHDNKLEEERYMQSFSNSGDNN
jgi:hypothetical protein